MTLDEFTATCTEAPDSSLVYLGELTIERTEAGFSLAIANQEWTDTAIAPLERLLWEWAVSEGYTL